MNSNFSDAFGQNRSAVQVWSVSGLCLAVTQTLQARFGTVVVEGEISGFVRAGSGHCYFNLKDDAGQLRCAMFKRHAGTLEFLPQDGNWVKVRARIDLYAPRGDLQLIVEGLEKAGMGPLLERFFQLKTRLQAEGLFDLSRKRELPEAPRAIGLVTSLGAAALRDVASALARRVPHIPVILVNAKVQGPEAPRELMQALERLRVRTQAHSAHPVHAPDPWVDVVLMVRGGGSIEDLWAFNDEALVRAIAAFPVPVVAGIGHETDFTLVDFVADVRAPTPTAAAELVSASRADRLFALDSLMQDLGLSVQRQLDLKEQWLDAASSRLGRPSDVLHRQSQQLAHMANSLSRQANAGWVRAQQPLTMLASQLPNTVRRYTMACEQRLERAQQAMHHLDPKNVLTRGYALLTNTDGQALTAAAQTHAGQQVYAQMKDGTLDLVVNGLSID